MSKEREGRAGGRGKREREEGRERERTYQIHTHTHFDVYFISVNIILWAFVDFVYRYI